MLQSVLDAKTTTAGMIRVSPIKLDANGELPTRIPLFVTGNWPNSIKGDFKVTLNDLKEVKQHFDEGIGFPTEDTSTGLAIDFMHEYDGMAAAWIKGLELESDENTGIGTLYADPVEWSDAGSEAVKGGRFKCVSPMGAFGTKGGKPSLWQSVIDLTRKLPNVIDGAGLTNIPFLQGMSPIRAAALPDENANPLDYEQIIFIRKSQQNKETPMTIDEVRVKNKDALTAEDLALLTEHKDELSADELKRFGLEANEKPAPADTLSAEDKDLLAAIRSGSKKVVDAEVIQKLDRLDSLEKTAQDYREEKAEQIVLSHIARGSVKPSEKDSTVKMLLSLDGDARKTFEDHLNALPSNELLSHEYGHKDEVVVTDVIEELDKKAKEELKAAKDDGRTITYGQAQRDVLSRDKDLNARYEAYRTQQKQN